MFEKWKKREAAKPRTPESASLKQFSVDELRAKADECRARVYNSRGFEFVPSGKTTLFPQIDDAERTKILLEEQSYLTEIDRREDTRVSRRDFWLEIAVIVLIVAEVGIDLWELHKEGIEFDRQQAVLTNLEKSSEATANTMVALQKTMETTNTGIQNQLSLNYEVSVGLILYRTNWTLRVTNRGRTNITLWGQKIAAEQRHILSSPLTITPGDAQDVDFASFFQKMTTGSPPPIEQLTTVPITIFLRSENGQEYTAECPFDKRGVMYGSNFVQCQTTTVRASNWSHESR
jgi:hypothetical protein